MPQAAKRYQPHGPRAGTLRPSSPKRGYGRRWQRLADRFRREHPWCVRCLERGIYNCGTKDKANHVDHIIPTMGLDDPRHFDWTNLQTLCKSCHSRKTCDDMRRGATR